MPRPRSGPAWTPSALLPEVEASIPARSLVLFTLAHLYALTGRFDEARAAGALARSLKVDLGQPLDAAGTSHVSGPMERLAGNLENC